MIKKLLPTLLAIAILQICFAHPFYVTIINMEYNSKNQSFETSFKVFTDDMENGIWNEYKVKANLIEKEPQGSLDTLIFKYFNDNFAVWVNGIKTKPELIGFESDFDVTSIYIEHRFQRNEIQNIKVKSTVLFNSFEDETNILNLEYKEKVQSEIFNLKNHLHLFEY